MTDDEVPSTDAPYLGWGKGRVAAQGWSNYQLARILSVRAPTVGRWRNGLLYPSVSSMKKIEAIFGWPAAEQIDLIPLTGNDIRWSMVFNEVLKEWMIANPRTVAVDELVPLVRSRAPGGGRPKQM
jgi:transcriptional regulator with XRE-family HTH domain